MKIIYKLSYHGHFQIKPTSLFKNNLYIIDYEHNT